MSQGRYLPKLGVWANDVIVAVNSDGSPIGSFGAASPVQGVDGDVYLSTLGIWAGGTVAVVNADGTPLAVTGGVGGSDPLKADLNSPAFTGVPTVPTAAGGTNTTQIASTAFVTTAVAGGAGGAPINSPTFTGIPAAPTAAPGTNTTQISTTAFVTAAVAAGGGGAPLNSPAFTGNPTAPTATPGDADTSIATTAFVAAAVVAGGGGGGGAFGVNAMDFAGADLGAKINAALDAGHFDVMVPNTTGLIISTTVRLRHACTIRFSARYPAHIVCNTNDKPVFEVTGQNRHWRIIGGIFDGAATNTPSCFLLCGRQQDIVGGGQCGDTTACDSVMCTGHWGSGNIVQIAAEIVTHVNCHYWVQGHGDSTWAGPKATVMIGNKDYWNVPFTYNEPDEDAGSCSGTMFQNCDIRGSPAAGSSVFLFKGQVEDTTIIPSYMNGGQRCHILIEPGLVGGSWVSPRRLSIYGGNRTECQGGAVPFVIVDGLSQANSPGIYHMSVHDISLFGHNTIYKTENGGRIYNLNHGGEIHIESATVLVDHQTSPFEWADIKCRHNIPITCTGQSLNQCTIHTAGAVNGTNGTGNIIQSSNLTDWVP